VVLEIRPGVCVAKPGPIWQLRARELRRISQQEISQRRTGPGVVGRGTEDGPEDGLAAAVNRVEPAPAYIATHFEGVRSLVPREIIGPLERILDVQIRTART